VNIHKVFCEEDIAVIGVMTWTSVVILCQFAFISFAILLAFSYLWLLRGHNCASSLDMLWETESLALSSSRIWGNLSVREEGLASSLKERGQTSIGCRNSPLNLFIHVRSWNLSKWYLCLGNLAFSIQSLWRN